MIPPQIARLLRPDGPEGNQAAYDVSGAEGHGSSTVHLRVRGDGRSGARSSRKRLPELVMGVALGPGEA